MPASLIVDFPASATTTADDGAAGRTVYVSSSAGRAGGDGRAPESAVRTLAEAAALVRDGRGDRLLLRRGDTFVGRFPRWDKSGRGPRDPLTIGAYGEGPRPCVTVSRGTALEIGGDGGAEVHDLRVAGLHFEAAGRDPDGPGYDPALPPAVGVHVRGPARRVTFEDCRVESFDDNLLVDAARDVTVRRCVIVDACASPARPTRGLVARDCHGLLVDKCVFDQNGGGSPADLHRHHHLLVAGGGRDVAVRGCLFARSGGTGVSLACGGAVVGNVFLGNTTHAVLGGAGGRFAGNAVVGGRETPLGDAPGARPDRRGPRADVVGNVFAQRRRGLGRPSSWHAAGATTAAPGGTRVADNVLFGCGGVGVSGAWRSVELVGNEVQDVETGQPLVSLRGTIDAAGRVGQRLLG